MDSLKLEMPCQVDGGMEKAKIVYISKQVRKKPLWDIYEKSFCTRSRRVEEAIQWEKAIDAMENEKSRCWRKH